MKNKLSNYLNTYIIKNVDLKYFLTVHYNLVYIGQSESQNYNATKKRYL
jgi:hypothetical protein